jgi:hypothetical protein
MSGDHNMYASGSGDGQRSGWRKRTIMEMAREAGGCDITSHGWTSWVGTQSTEFLERFAELVRADEREVCAVIADGQLRNTNALLTYPPQSSAAYQIGVAIRARGQE